MKKLAYLIGSIEMVVGAVLLSLASITKIVLPVLGRVAYQSAAAGSYSSLEYKVEFPLVTILGVLLLIIGLIQIIYAILKGKVKPR